LRQLSRIFLMKDDQTLRLVVASPALRGLYAAGGECLAML
jgi:hypothetical protein